MTVTAKTRPPKPETPGSGLEYFAVPAEGWRVARDGSTCRQHAPAMGVTACGEPAVAEKHHPNDPVSPWWAYCAEHARTYGRPDVLLRGVWAEGGKVLKWGLCRADGTPATVQEIARARAKYARTRERPERGPADTGPLSLRVRNDLRQDTEDAARDSRTDVSTWIREAMQARLGYLRCYKCRENDPPVPLEFGDLTGMTLGEGIADAAEQVKRQHPRHEPVTIGASPAARPTSPGDVPFISPAVKR